MPRLTIHQCKKVIEFWHLEKSATKVHGRRMATVLPRPHFSRFFLWGYLKEGKKEAGGIRYQARNRGRSSSDTLAF